MERTTDENKLEIRNEHFYGCQFIECARNTHFIL